MRPLPSGSRGMLLPAALLLLFLTGPASAATLSFDVVPDPNGRSSGIWSNIGGVVTWVAKSFEGELTLESDGPIALGTHLTFQDLQLQATGALCPGCGMVGIEIALDASKSSVLEIIPDVLEPGTLATMGSLFTIWTLTGSFGTLELAVSSVTQFVGTRNTVRDDFFRAGFRNTSVTPLGPVPQSVDLTNLERFKFSSVRVVPEPAALSLLGLGGLSALRVRSRAAAARRSSG